MPRAQERNGRAEDRVFNAILDAVLDHRLAPGTKLTERELTEIFGVSRGAVIANPSSSETHDLFEARRVIESALMQRLARNITAKQIAELRAFVASEQRAYDRGDRKAGQRLSIRFHKVLSEFAGNAALDRFMEQLICRTPLLALARTGRIAYCGAADHREVVEALARRDAAAAARRMSEHLNNVERQLGGVDEPQMPQTLAAVFSA